MFRRFYRWNVKVTFDHHQGRREVQERIRSFGARIGWCAEPPGATNGQLGPGVGSKRRHSDIDEGESSEDAQNTNLTQKRKIKSVRGRSDRCTTAILERDKASSILETQGPYSPSSGSSPVSSGNRDLNDRPRAKRQKLGKRGGEENGPTDRDEEDEGVKEEGEEEEGKEEEEEEEEEKEGKNEEEKKKEKGKARKVVKPSKTQDILRAKGAGIKKQRAKQKSTGGVKAKGRAAIGKEES
ncbi:hypothetical protein BDR22DRAFT_520965 [Usnea florida]